MKQPNDFLSAIRSGDPIHWEVFLKVMGRHGVMPATICRILAREASMAQRCRVQILDDDAFRALEIRFPVPVAVASRVSAAVAGNSHQAQVDGNMLVVHQAHWQHPKVAVCWDGRSWSPIPQDDMHLLIVENLQNFLCFTETLRLVNQSCGMSAPTRQIVLAYGAGNAAAKLCNAQYYQHFRSLSCLFDLDRGGIQIYSALKSQMSSTDVPVRFLVPDDVRERLSRSRWWLDDEERRYLHRMREVLPEISALIDLMYQSHKKLEQETYLEN